MVRRWLHELWDSVELESCALGWVTAFFVICLMLDVGNLSMGQLSHPWASLVGDGALGVCLLASAWSTIKTARRRRQERGLELAMARNGPLVPRCLCGAVLMTSIGDAFAPSYFCPTCDDPSKGEASGG